MKRRVLSIHAGQACQNIDCYFLSVLGYNCFLSQLWEVRALYKILLVRGETGEICQTETFRFESPGITRGHRNWQIL